ncbi:MAG: hypothetical protein KKH28_09525 [Elusimicrobia bacterium]|nr:hypothetical protein [Elusimicrobiota bacterium]
MSIWTDGKTLDKVADGLLRKNLIQCYQAISRAYPEFANLDPANAAEYLIHLRNTGRIRIELFNETHALIGCRIVDRDPETK